MTQLHVTFLAGLISLAAALNARGLQKTVKHDDDLAFVHVPFNFGHTVEVTHLMPTADLNKLFTGLNDGVNGEGTQPIPLMIAATLRAKFHASDAWGRFDSKLHKTLPVTGCGLYYSPQKYWPEDLAKNTFGGKTVFGLLRDPYERLVAMFRGNFEGYGGYDPKFVETCDVDGAINMMMHYVIEKNDPFVSDCTFLPQAEFFDGPYGINLPVDNRRFPQSMNEVFEEHGYSDRIEGQNILHVTGCNDVWAGNLTAETKQLVKKVYARDFELLCKHFGYCDEDENTCLTGVYHMCPDELFSWDTEKMQYISRSQQM